MLAARFKFIDCYKLFLSKNQLMTDSRLKPLLADSEQYLRLIYDNLTEGLLVIRVEAGGNLRCVSFNRSALAITGFDSDVVLNRPISEVLDFNVSKKVADEIRAAIEAREPRRLEATLETPNGKKILDTVLVPVMDESGTFTHVLGIASDITSKISSDAKEKVMAQRQALLNSII